MVPTRRLLKALVNSFYEALIDSFYEALVNSFYEVLVDSLDDTNLVLALGSFDTSEALARQPEYVRGEHTLCRGLTHMQGLDSHAGA